MNAFSSEKRCRLQFVFDIRPTGTQISLMALFQGAQPDHMQVDSLSCFPGEVGSFVHSILTHNMWHIVLQSENAFELGSIRKLVNHYLEKSSPVTFCFQVISCHLGFYVNPWIIMEFDFLWKAPLTFLPFFWMTCACAWKLLSYRVPWFIFWESLLKFTWNFQGCPEDFRTHLKHFLASVPACSLPNILQSVWVCLCFFFKMSKLSL